MDKEIRIHYLFELLDKAILQGKNDIITAVFAELRKELEVQPPS